MQFTKMHGLGRSYVLFNLLEDPMENADFPELSKLVSNVNVGIGSDGIILICPSDRADFKMRVFKKDGIEANNCMSGIQCIATYLYDTMYAESSNFTIETLGGDVSVKAEVGEKGKVKNVMVDMGEPQSLKMEIPLKGGSSSIIMNEPLTIDEIVYSPTCVSIENPFAIVFVKDINEVPVQKISTAIENSKNFPKHTNAIIVQVINRQEIQYRIMESGSDYMMECSTGACEAVVAAALNNLIDRTLPITVHLPLGKLTVKWDDRNHVWTKGEARYVCYGELEEMTFQNT